jgi:adenosylmethionine---8-amino-7-oxononanoate aminotransferase
MELSLTQRDQAVIWHPYTQHKGMLPPVPIERGEGALLFDHEGNSYIDAISSWWVTLHGHGNAYIASSIFEQAARLEQVIFTGFTHLPAIRLAERLLEILPGNCEKIFYSDNGSTAVEVALKMCIQFWRNSTTAGSAAKRNKILAFHHAYHGDTFGSMSVSGRSVFTEPFRDFLFEVIFIDTPNAENIEALKEIVRQQGPCIAGFIYEPLLQAAGGMRIYEARWLDELLAEIQSFEILCIADEVLTGFGRTGRLFAGCSLTHFPDIVCLSKGLTGGTLAMGVTACSQKIYEAFLSDDKSRTFFHGHSYTANPIACAAALASLDLLEKETCVAQIQGLETANRQFALRLADRNIRNLRTLGTVLAFELNQGTDGYLNPAGRDIHQSAMNEGIFLRPLGNTVYIMPPYCISSGQLEKIYDFLNRLTGRL